MELDGKLLSEISEQFGDSFYILDIGKFIYNYKKLKSAFSSFYGNSYIAYSYKTNYIPILCRKAAELGAYAEVVSEMEYELAKRVGTEAKKIILNGPVKSRRAAEELLISGGQMNIDSESEMKMLGEISAANPGKRLRVGIRCNFGVSGSVSRFGIDTASDEFERVLRRIQSSEGLILSGLHCHFSERGAEAWKSKVAGMLELVEKFGLKEIESVDFGGGFYGKMPDSLKLQFPCAIPSFEEYAEIVALPFAKFAKEYDNPPKLIIEPGTALAADTMRLATKVVSIKNIRGKTIATLSGSIYNINPAANGKNLPVTVYNRDASSAKIYEGVDFAGYTCIESDYLHRNYTGKLAEGDFAVFDNAGSYSIVLKPPFILPNFPVICIEESTGRAQLIKKGEDFDDVFHTYVFE